MKFEPHHTTKRVDLLKTLPSTKRILLLLQNSKTGMTRLDIEYAIACGDLASTICKMLARHLIRTTGFTNTGPKGSRLAVYAITRTGQAALGEAQATTAPAVERITNFNKGFYVPADYKHMGRVGLAVYQ